MGLVFSYKGANGLAFADIGKKLLRKGSSELLRKVYAVSNINTEIQQL